MDKDAGRKTVPDWASQGLRCALRLYPQGFRHTYGSEMEAVFRRLWLDHRRHSRGGALRFWLRTVANIAVTALLERGESWGCRQLEGQLEESEVSWLETIGQDLRYGLRSLKKSPGFTLVAVVVLAVGIGANTALFGFANALLLQPVSLPEPDRVVRLYGASLVEGGYNVFSYPNYADLRDQSRSFEHLAVHRNVEVGLETGGEEWEARGELVSGNYFQTLGIEAASGRVVTPDDDGDPEPQAVIVLSDRLWKSRFGGSLDVLGKTLRLDGHPFTVVGVTPSGFRGTYESFANDFWIPITFQEQVRHTGLTLDRRGWGWLSGTGRLRDSASLTQAEAELDVISARLREDHPDANADFAFRVVPASRFPERDQGNARAFLSFFLLVVTLVLLVSCANIASVLLARVVARRREIAIRQSLGATRRRLLQQWLVESLLLALLGGLASLLVALWSQSALLALIQPMLGSSELTPPVTLNGSVLGFAFLVTAIAGVLFGVFPALQAGRRDLSGILSQEGAAGGGWRTRAFGFFVTAEVSISIVLLIVAGLLLRTLEEARRFDPGFDSERVLLAGLNLRSLGLTPPQGQELQKRILERLEALPGVEAVSLALVVPLGGDVEKEQFSFPGQEATTEKTVLLDLNGATAGYFRTMGIDLKRGRVFDARDERAGAPAVVVINETMARRYWSDRDAVGQRLRRGESGPEAEIIGVVSDIDVGALGEEPRPYLYHTPAAGWSTSPTIHVRAADDPAMLTELVRASILELAPGLRVRGPRPFDELRASALFPQRALAQVTGFFAMLALVLAAVGLYGILSYAVTGRTREIGVRMALGARREDVLWMMLRQGLWLTTVGVGIGLAIAWAATRSLDRLLFGVTPTDPLTFLGISLLMALVATGACLIPAQRATRIDPVEALRYE